MVLPIKQDSIKVEKFEFINLSGNLTEASIVTGVAVKAF